MSRIFGGTLKTFSIFAVLLILTGLAVAEEKAPMKVVRVTGTSDVKVVPDQAVIEIGVEKQSPSASVAKHAEDAAARGILNSLRANGIAEKDVQTTYLSLQPQSITRKGVRISYFVAEQTLSVTVRDLAKLDALLEALVRAGGNRIDSIRYETSDLRKYRDQARELAVKAAREKAHALAQALGQEIGKAQSIEEMANYGYSSAMANGFVFAEKERDRAGEPATAAGQSTVSASVIVSFELN
jgi:uncharacterized protein YggE